MQADPLRWIGLGVLPALPFVLAAMAFVYVHRVVLVQHAWAGWVPWVSVGSSLLVVLAWQLRGVGQGRLAREVVLELEPRAAKGLAPGGGGARRRFSLAALSVLAPVATVSGTVLFLFPGLLVAAFFVPVAAVVAVEGRDVGSAIGRLRSLPSGTMTKGLSSVLLMAVLYGVAWVNLLVGSQLLLFLTRILTGADVTALGRVFSPANETFLAASLLMALVCLEPLWGILRSLVYLDARLGESGADLEGRWRELAGQAEAQRGGPGGPRLPRGLGVLLAAGGLLFLAAAPAVAQDEANSSLIGETGLFVDGLERLADELDQKIADYDSSGYEKLDSVHAYLQLFDREHVELPDGRVLEFDPKPLSEDCPDRIHDPGTRGKAARVSLRIRRAIEDVRRASDPSWTGGDERLAAGASAQELLDEELAGGGYELEGDRVEGDEYRSGLQERFLEWWEELLRGFEPESQQPVPQGQPWLPSFDGRWLMAAIALLLAGVILVFLLGQTGRLRPGVPELDLGRQDFGGDLPDARVRSPLAWREHADALMAEGLTREAMRAQFLAVLARLDRTREIDYRTERTNGEHLRSFRGGAERRTLFVDATRLFEIAWYGAGEVGQADYGLLTASCDPLILDDPAPVAAAGALAGGDPSEQGRAHA